MIKFRQYCSGLLDHYTLVTITITLAILSMISVGAPIITCTLGLILCIIGLYQKEFRVDIIVVALIALYNLCNIFSAFAHTGSIVAGYAPLQIVIIPLYILVTCLSDKDAQLLRMFCAIWFAVAAVSGIIQVLLVPQGSMHRASGILSNPNALGIILVLGWFLLLNLNRLRRLEPIILSGLALTLSMGSFVSMAVGIMFIVGYKIRQGESYRDIVRFLSNLLAQAVIGVSAGMLLYIAVSRTNLFYIGWLVGIYIVVLAFYWDEICDFISIHQKVAVCLTIAGVLIAFTAILLRPSSIATFAERIAMIKNGFKYICVHPLVGVGPFQWRILNLSDSDKYFNTWHIHNAFVHSAVEFGWISAITLIALFLYAFKKYGSFYQKAALVAFVCHNMMDTSFFYIGITSVILVSMVDVRNREINICSLEFLRILLVFVTIYLIYILIKIPLF